MFGDEETDFCLGWRKPPCPDTEAVFNVSVDAWKHTSGGRVFVHVTYKCNRYMFYGCNKNAFIVKIERYVPSNVYIYTYRRSIALFSSLDLS